jgi:hypothetical protein
MTLRPVADICGAVGCSSGHQSLRRRPTEGCFDVAETVSPRSTDKASRSKTCTRKSVFALARMRAAGPAVTRFPKAPFPRLS